MPELPRAQQADTGRRIASLAGLLAAALVAISGCTSAPTITPTPTAEPIATTAESAAPTPAATLTAAPTNMPTLTAEPTTASTTPAATPAARECLYVYLQDVSSYSGPGTMAPQLQRLGDDLANDAARLRDGTLPADDADFLAGFVAFLIGEEAERAVEAEAHGATAIAAAFAEIAQIMSQVAKAWPDDKARAAGLIAEAANTYRSLGEWLAAC